MIKIVNLRKEKYDIYIGRGSKWGNPFSHLNDTLAIYKVKSRNKSIECYKDWILFGDGKYLLDDLDELDNKVLGCFCKPKKCHGDILIELINNKKKNII